MAEDENSEEFKKFVKSMVEEEPELTGKLVKIAKRLTVLSLKYGVPPEEMEPLITDFVDMASDVTMLQLKSLKKRLQEVV